MTKGAGPATLPAAHTPGTLVRPLASVLTQVPGGVCSVSAPSAAMISWLATMRGVTNRAERSTMVPSLTYLALAIIVDMTTLGPYVRREARPGRESDIANFHRSALPLVEADPARTAWCAIQMGPPRSASSMPL